jgi:Fe-S cluster biosynthesis and repair protein YggX
MSGDHSHPPSQSSSPAGARLVHCVKLQAELPGLDAPPWPGEIGQRIYNEVSAQAWKQWEERQKMILNEYRLLPWQKEGQELIRTHMEEFFFGDNAALPPGYVPPRSK